MINSCKDDGVDLKKEAKSLMQASTERSKYAFSRSIEQTLNYWADDAILISPGRQELQGKEEIRKMVEQGLNDPNFEINWEPQSAEISECGDMGYLLEDATITTIDSTGQPKKERYRSVTIWKKQPDGSWKNVVDIMCPKKE